MKRKGRLLGFLLLLVLVLALPVTAQARAKISGASKPSTIKKGSFFNLKGRITSPIPLKEVRVTIYNSNGKKCLQRYHAHPNSKQYDLRQADPYICFDKLNVGQYYLRVLCINRKGSKNRVINKKFKVIGGGQIRIVNPKPSANITLKEGASFGLGGKITSTNKLAKVAASIMNTSTKKKVYSKYVKPRTNTYNLQNSALDAAMQFDKLLPGTYKLKVAATDSQGTVATLIYRTVVISKNTVSTGPSSNGSNGSEDVDTPDHDSNVQMPDDYLDANGIVVRPAGYVARTTRPAYNNPYYYNKKHNIYYGYNSLAPTGKPYYGNHYVLGNCTWYACGRAMEIVAKAGGNIARVKAIFGGDPVNIYNMNVTKNVFRYGKEPKIGALAIFNYGSNGDAHIAVVEDIVNGVPYVSESGYTVSSEKPNGSKSNIVFRYQSIYNWASGRSLRGYIYLI